MIGSKTMTTVFAIQLHSDKIENDNGARYNNTTRTITLSIIIESIVIDCY